MAVENPALYIQASEHPAENFRHLITTVMGGQGGVVKSTDLAVTQRGTPNMSVDVAGGTVVILGTEATHQGAYLCHNRGVTNLPISVGDATFTRYDLVVAQVEDADYSGATNAWKLAVIAGTPAATPLFPTVPDNTVVLATVLVPINESTSIDNADITDIRTTSDTDGTTTLRNRGLAPAPGVIVCTSGNRPEYPFIGMEIYETDTTQNYIWDGTNWKEPVRFTGDSSSATRVVYWTGDVTTSAGGDLTITASTIGLTTVVGMVLNSGWDANLNGNDWFTIGRISGGDIGVRVFQGSATNGGTPTIKANATVSLSIVAWGT